MSVSNPSVEDVEKGKADYAHLENATVHSFSWRDVTVTVKDRRTKQPLEILAGVDGIVEAGWYPFLDIKLQLIISDQAKCWP